MKVKADFSRPRTWDTLSSNIEIEPKRTAFVVIDVQNDFVSDYGYIHVKTGWKDMSRFRKILEPIRKVAGACRRIGIPVIYTQHQHRPDLSDVGPEWGTWHKREGDVPIGEKVGPPGYPKDRLGVLIKGTWNTEIAKEIAPQPGDIIVEKYRYSAFYNTELEMILRKLQINTLMFSGITTNTCVGSSVRDAFFRDFRCVLISDCAATWFDHWQKFEEEYVRLMIGYVTTSKDVLEATEQVIKVRV